MPACQILDTSNALQWYLSPSKPVTGVFKCGPGSAARQQVCALSGQNLTLDPRYSVPKCKPRVFRPRAAERFRVVPLGPATAHYRIVTVMPVLALGMGYAATYLALVPRPPLRGPINRARNLALYP